jgi:hypothetical protein
LWRSFSLKLTSATQEWHFFNGSNRAYITTYDGWGASYSSVSKSFTFAERMRLDFRAEAFNLLNRVVFSAPNTNLNSNSFGLVTWQLNSSRQMQIALKLYW